MYGGIFMSATSSRLAQVYNTNLSQLAQNYMHVASGRRLLKPADNIADYLHAGDIERSGRGFESVRENVIDGQGVVDAAETAGTMMFDALNRMHELVGLYNSTGTSADEQAGWAQEFSQHKIVVQSLVDNSYYSGKQLISDSSANPLITVQLDPDDRSQSFAVSFTAADAVLSADIAALDISAASAAADVDTQLGKAGNFLGKAVAFRIGMASQFNIVTTKINSGADQVSNLRDADISTEMSRQVDYQIRSSVSLSMMTQANMLGGGVLKLLR